MSADFINNITLFASVVIIIQWPDVLTTTLLTVAIKFSNIFVISTLMVKHVELSISDTIYSAFQHILMHC